MERDHLPPLRPSKIWRVTECPVSPSTSATTSTCVALKPAAAVRGRDVRGVNVNSDHGNRSGDAGDSPVLDRAGCLADLHARPRTSRRRDRPARAGLAARRGRIPQGLRPGPPCRLRREQEARAAPASVWDSPGRGTARIPRPRADRSTSPPRTAVADRSDHGVVRRARLSVFHCPARLPRPLHSGLGVHASVSNHRRGLRARCAVSISFPHRENRVVRDRLGPCSRVRVGSCDASVISIDRRGQTVARFFLVRIPPLVGRGA